MRSRLQDVHSRGMGHVYGTCIFGSWVTNMGQGGGHDYGTGRTRKWDGTAGGVMKIWTG